MNIWGYLINPCKSYIILYYSHIGTILGLAIHSNHPGTSFDHLRAPDVMGLVFVVYTKRCHISL